MLNTIKKDSFLHEISQITTEGFLLPMIHGDHPMVIDLLDGLFNSVFSTTSEVHNDSFQNSAKLFSRNSS